MYRVKLCPGRVDILSYISWIIGIPRKMMKKNRPVIKAYATFSRETTFVAFC